MFPSYCNSLKLRARFLPTLFFLGRPCFFYLPVRKTGLFIEFRPLAKTGPKGKVNMLMMSLLTAGVLGDEEQGK